MSSKVNEALFDLIQSLTKSEKRYFKLYASRHTIGEMNNYVLIFDYLDKQNEYDEDALTKYFNGQAFLNRFSITKKRLYDQILSALDAYYSSSSIEIQLHKQLHAAKILYSKSLYEQSKRVLISAEKAARKHEKNEILLEVLGQRKKLIETVGYLNTKESEIAQIPNDENEVLKEIQELNFLWDVKSQLFLRLAKKGVARNEEEAIIYLDVCQGVIEESISIDQSTEVQYYRHHIKSAYFFSIGDLKNSLLHLTKNLDICREEKNFKIEPNKHLSVLTNAIYIADKLGDNVLASNCLNELKVFANTVETNEDLEIKMFSSISSIELSLLLRKGEFDRASQVAIDIKSKLEEYEGKLSSLRRAYLEFKLAVASLGNGEFSQALHWINSVLNNNELDKSEDLISFTHLLDLLVHVELKHEKLLPYTLKSTHRFLKTRNRLYDFEKVFLQFIGKIIKSEDPFEKENLWEELYQTLANIPQDNSFQSVAMEYFDFKAWAEAKLKRKNFNIVVKENYNRQKIAS